MKTIAELTTEVRTANAQTKKGLGEIKDKIKKLEDIIAAGGDTSELEAAVAELKGTAQEVDDQVVVEEAPANNG